MQERNISRDNFEQCLKCNLCTTVCPMHEANPHYSGPKQVGPDGERYRLKDPKYFDLTLKFCLNCKRCEVACPSGVKVGDMIQRARMNYGRQSHLLRDLTLASTDLVGTVASTFAPIVNPVLSAPVVKKVMDAVLKVDSNREFPAYSSETFCSWYKHVAGEQEAYSKTVNYFHGCYVNYNFPELGKDMVTLANACGFGVSVVEDQRCCGVALISNGFRKLALKGAKQNLDAFRLTTGPIVATSSTCAFTMRDEYRDVLELDNSDVRDRIQLATKWLFSLVESGKVRLAFKEDYHKRITYHTACHMQKLGWAIYSVRLLSMIPGVELNVPVQNCCGIAGTFGFKKENYPYSQKIGEKLFDSLRESNPDVVCTDCETCKWQIEMSTPFKVMNPISVLVEALDIEKTTALNENN